MAIGYGIGYGNVNPWASSNAAQYLGVSQGPVLVQAKVAAANATIGAKSAQINRTPITPPANPPGMRPDMFYGPTHQAPPIIKPAIPPAPQSLWYGHEHSEAPLSPVPMKPVSQESPTRGARGFEVPQDSVATKKLFENENLAPIIAVIAAIVIFGR